MEPKLSKTIIETRNLTRIYALGESNVIGINTIDLSIDAGELVVLKGDSGSGKSTLLSLLAGLDRPTRGELTVADHDLATATPTNLTHFRREVVGMVFQAFNLMPTLNVLENASLPGLLAGKNPATVKSKAMALMDWLGLSRRRNHLPAQLSGGEMQRTAIARALINDPDIIIADEPTAHLDSALSAELLDILADLNAAGATVVFATHDPRVMEHPIVDRRLALVDGRVVGEGGR